MDATLFKVNGTKKKVEINCIKEIQFLVDGDIARLKFMDGTYFYNEEAEDFYERKHQSSNRKSYKSYYRN